ncbi:Cof-type HAD-IIB family hydrolase [Lacrimispora aerotolerans]|uniref:Cof-type HAD-IIB family hydrolase n=1 Tax=Lacrimispora aerotolerans TaxID=36832 RepID=UPI0004795448|nr:Cof-type HAD-IIB family hydrolase [Lacrimispora aerotolerans]
MDIKLIALDLDGTLLDSKKQLSEANRKALTECIQNGILIVPCTGRTADGIPSEIKDIDGIRYAIATNGAVIHDLKEKAVLDTRMLTWEKAMELLEFVDNYPVMYDPYIEGRGITEPKFFENLSDYCLTDALQDLVKKTRDLHPSIIDYVRNTRKPVEKINLFFPDMEGRARLRAELNKQADILVTSSISNNLEINALGASKGEAIHRLADLLGIDRAQTMAIGDGENDFTMIRMAGVGVAMKNASKELQAEANYVTETNDDDGVAAAIYRLVFGKQL